MSIYVKQDDGLKEFFLCEPIDWKKGKDQILWCRKTFKEKTWCYHQHQGVIYFEHEHDMAWFKLRWA